MNWTSGLGFGPSSISSPMDTLTNRTQTNADYKVVARDFADRYMSASFFSLTCIDPYYTPESLISLAITKGNQSELHEFKGCIPFREKLASMGANSIKYSSPVIISQPFGNQSLIISIHSKAEISNGNYSAAGTFLIKLIDGAPKIAHHMLEIFM